MGYAILQHCSKRFNNYFFSSCSFLSLFSVDQLFREANINPNGVVKYEEFVRILCAPVPDYY